MVMLAGKIHEARLHDGRYAKHLALGDSYCLSPKIDGVRCKISPAKYYAKTDSRETVISRNGKPIANKHIRDILSHLPIGFDGEIASSDPTNAEAYKDAIHAAMTIEGEPDDWCFHIFNFETNVADRFEERMQLARRSLAIMPESVLKHCKIVQQYRYGAEPEEVEAMLQQANNFLADGYEGAMLSTTNAPYIDKRCSHTKPWLLKLKPFQDAEAKIVGFIQGMYGDKLKTVPEELWNTAKEECGALILQDCEGKYKNFRCGSGLTAELKKGIWANQSEYLGKYVTFKFLGCGTDERPRHPVFLRFRPEEDMPNADV